MRPGGGCAPSGAWAATSCFPYNDISLRPHCSGRDGARLTSYRARAHAACTHPPPLHTHRRACARTHLPVRQLCESELHALLDAQARQIAVGLERSSRARAACEVERQDEMMHTGRVAQERPRHAPSKPTSFWRGGMTPVAR